MFDTRFPKSCSFQNKVNTMYTFSDFHKMSWIICFFRLFMHLFPMELLRFSNLPSNSILHTIIRTLWTQSFPLHCMNNQEYTVPCFSSFMDAFWGRITLCLCPVAWIHNWKYTIFLNDELNLYQTRTFLLRFNFNCEDGWRPSIAWLHRFPSEPTTQSPSNYETSLCRLTQQVQKLFHHLLYPQNF
jgi:hypothetical protein